jgi:hypothetical protein
MRRSARLRAHAWPRQRCTGQPRTWLAHKSLPSERANYLRNRAGRSVELASEITNPWPGVRVEKQRSSQPHPWRINSARVAAVSRSATTTCSASGRARRSPSATRWDTCAGVGADMVLSCTRTRCPPALSRIRSGPSSLSSATTSRPRPAARPVRISAASETSTATTRVQLLFGVRSSSNTEQ